MEAVVFEATIYESVVLEATFMKAAVRCWRLQSIRSLLFWSSESRRRRSRWSQTESAVFEATEDADEPGILALLASELIEVDFIRSLLGKLSRPKNEFSNEFLLSYFRYGLH